MIEGLDSGMFCKYKTDTRTYSGVLTKEWRKLDRHMKGGRGVISQCLSCRSGGGEGIEDGCYIYHIGSIISQLALGIQ